MDMLVSVLVKAQEVPEAIRKAIEDAKKTLLKFQPVVLQSSRSYRSLLRW